jgi:hypothetical protein
MSSYDESKNAIINVHKQKVLDALAEAVEAANNVADDDSSCHALFGTLLYCYKRMADLEHLLQTYNVD